MIDTLFREQRDPAHDATDRTRIVLHLARQDMSDPSLDHSLLADARVVTAHDETRCQLDARLLTIMGSGDLEYRVRPFRIVAPAGARLCPTCAMAARHDHPDPLTGLSPLDGITLAR